MSLLLFSILCLISAHVLDLFVTFMGVKRGFVERLPSARHLLFRFGFKGLIFSSVSNICFFSVLAIFLSNYWAFSWIILIIPAIPHTIGFANNAYLLIREVRLNEQKG